MAKRKKQPEKEPEDRECAICGESVLRGGPLHRCDEPCLEKLHKDEEGEEESEEDIELSYNEKLDYGNFLHNMMENDYDQDDE